MILIAHRGNTSGPNPEKENNPQYVDKAIDSGYNVEIDLRGSIDNRLYLGHDMPQYEITPDWLFERSEYLWIHTKDIMSLHSLTNQTDRFNVFWHQHDDYTLTTKGFIWAYPGSILTPNTICVMPERAEYSDTDLSDCLGICSDYINSYKERKQTHG